MMKIQKKGGTLMNFTFQKMILGMCPFHIFFAEISRWFSELVFAVPWPPSMRLGLVECSEHPWLIGAVASTCVFQPPESPTKVARVDSIGPMKIDEK